MTRLEVTKSSNSFRPGLFASLALAYDGGSEPVPEVVGEFVELGIAVDLDGFLGGIADHVAVVAPRQVIFELGFGPRVERAIEVVG